MSDKSTALVPRTLDEAKEMARIVSVSALLPAALRNRVEDVFVTLLAGQELGLAPMQAIRSMHIINGKPVLSAELMVALCKRRKDVCRFFQLVESTATVATYSTQRDGDPEPTRMSWTIDHARTAGLLNNPTWQKHPAAMLRARCSSSLARAVYPDLVLGVVEEDEAEEIRRDTRPVFAPPVDAVDVEAEPVTGEPRARVEGNSFDGVTGGAVAITREVDLPMAEAAPIMAFDEVHAVMNRIPQLFGEAKKRERQCAYYACFGHVGACPARWNPGAQFAKLPQEDREAVLARVKELATKMADDLPDWGSLSGKPEPEPKPAREPCGDDQ